MKKVILLVCMLCLALPMFANSREDLVKYLVQEIETVNAQTSLKRLAQLTFAGKIIFGEGSRDPFFLLISMKMKPETRTIKEKSALYARMNFADPQMKQDALDVLFAGKEPVELTDQDEELETIATALKDFVEILGSNTDSDKLAAILDLLKKPTEGPLVWYFQEQWRESSSQEKRERVNNLLEALGIADEVVNSQKKAEDKLRSALEKRGDELGSKMLEDYRNRLEESYAPLTHQEIEKLDKILNYEYWGIRKTVMVCYCTAPLSDEDLVERDLTGYLKSMVKEYVEELEGEIRLRLNMTDKPYVTPELIENTEWVEWN